MREQFLQAGLHQAQRDIGELKQENTDLKREIRAMGADLQKEIRELREANSRMLSYREQQEAYVKRFWDQTYPKLEDRVTKLEGTVWKWAGGLGVAGVVLGSLVSYVIKHL